MELLNVVISAGGDAASLVIEPIYKVWDRFTGGRSQSARAERATLYLRRILDYVVDPPAATRLIPEKIGVVVAFADSTVELTLTNFGAPIDPEDFRRSFHDHPFLTLDFASDRVGQRIKARVSVSGAPVQAVAAKTPKAAGDEAFEVRAMRPGEEFKLTSLFHRVYKYRYIDGRVYYPERLKDLTAAGNLTSFVGVDAAGDFLSHVGVMRHNADPLVLEAGLGVVDPASGNRGLFRKTFDRALQHMQSFDYAYCLYDFVTNHDLSQKMVARYGYCDMALFVGNQISETQARLSELGLGADPGARERYSLLLAIHAKETQPFGERIILPINLGEALDFLLRDLKISWEPVSRFHTLGCGGDYTVKVQEEQQAAVFTMHAPGREALRKIIEETAYLSRTGLIYFAVEFPLDVRGVGQIYDVLAAAGFFMAGFTPFQFSRRLGFRMQFLAPAQLDFARIKLQSVTGQRLLEVVRDDYERNRIL